MPHAGLSAAVVDGVGARLGVLPANNRWLAPPFPSKVESAKGTFAGRTNESILSPWGGGLLVLAAAQSYCWHKLVLHVE